MKVAFTICANNYLAHAKTLADSFKKFHPDIPLYIGLVDERSASIDYDKLGADKVLNVMEILRDEFHDLSKIYGIAEFCTVVKPALIEYFRDDIGAKSVIYLDPDIEVFSRLEEVLELLGTKDMILTPHMCSPTGEEGHPMDKDIMRTGVYNLGFLALNVDNNAISDFITWWDKRVRAYGFHDLPKGHFYDQIWFSYATCFLEKVAVLRHLGYNLANWNLHERRLIKDQGIYYVNSESTILRFLHFSHFKPEAIPEIASYNDKFNLTNRPDLEEVFQSYIRSLTRNDYDKLKNIPYVYGKTNQKSPEHSRLKLVGYYLKKSITTLIFGK